MSLVNYETGEIVDRPTAEEVRASVKRVIDHAESIWDEWAWQVENETWLVLGHESWDEMRRAEYGNLNRISAPRKETPELVARFRDAGLKTQREIADTLGVSQRTVSNHDEPRQEHPARESSNFATSDPEVVDAELVEDEPITDLPVPEGDDPHEYESACHVDPSGGVNDLRRLLAGWDKYLANYYDGPSRSQLDVLAGWLGKHQRKTTRARRATQ